jgi:hypothetical protein
MQWGKSGQENRTMGGRRAGMRMFVGLKSYIYFE